MIEILLICLAIYLFANFVFMLYLMGVSGTIGRIYEWQEFKRNLPKGRDWFKFIGCLFYLIPLYLLVMFLTRTKKA